MYRAVIFDFDGTIIDTEQHLFDVINMHLEKAKEKPISIDFYRSNIGGRALALHHYLIEIFGEEKVAKIYQEHHEHARHLPLRQGLKRSWSNYMHVTFRWRLRQVVHVKT